MKVLRWLTMFVAGAVFGYHLYEFRQELITQEVLNRLNQDIDGIDGA